MRDGWERLGRVVVGGCSPAHVAIAMLLGLLSGFAAGGNWTFVCLLVATALINVHGKTWLVAWTAGCVLALLLGGLTAKLGALVLDHTWAGKLVAACGESLPVALLRWNNYQLAGGLALALPLGAILGICAATLVRRLREDMEFAQQTDPRGHVTLPTGFAEVFFFGASDAGAQHFSTGWLRPRGFALAALIVPIAALSTAVLLPRTVQRELLARLSEVNGAPVTTDGFHVSSWSGEITAYDVGVADPDDLSRDRLRIGRLHAEINTAALLQGRLDADTLELTHVSFNVRRFTPADPLTNQKPSADLVRLRAQPQHAEVSCNLATIVRDWPHWQTRLDGMQRCLLTFDALARTDFWPANRSRLRDTRPALCVRRMKVDPLMTGSRGLLEVSNLASKSAGQTTQTRIHVVLPDGGTEITAQLAPDVVHAHTLHVQATNLPLFSLLLPHAAGSAVNLAETTVTLEGDGSFDSHSLDLAIDVQAEQLSPLVGSEPVAGVAPAVWNAVLASAGTYQVSAKLTGPWSDLVLSTTTERLTAGLKEALKDAGQVTTASASESIDAVAASRYPSTHAREDYAMASDAAQVAATSATSPAAVASSERYAAASVASAPKSEVPAAIAALAAGMSEQTAIPATHNGPSQTETVTAAPSDASSRPSADSVAAAVAPGTETPATTVPTTDTTSATAAVATPPAAAAVAALPSAKSETAPPDRYAAYRAQRAREAGADPSSPAATPSPATATASPNPPVTSSTAATAAEPTASAERPRYNRREAQPDRYAAWRQAHGVASPTADASSTSAAAATPRDVPPASADPVTATPPVRSDRPVDTGSLPDSEPLPTAAMLRKSRGARAEAVTHVLPRDPASLANNTAPASPSPVASTATGALPGPIDLPIGYEPRSPVAAAVASESLGAQAKVAPPAATASHSKLPSAAIAQAEAGAPAANAATTAAIAATTTATVAAGDTDKPEKKSSRWFRRYSSDDPWSKHKADENSTASRLSEPTTALPEAATPSDTEQKPWYKRIWR